MRLAHLIGFFTLVDYAGAAFARLGPKFANRLSAEDSVEMARICGKTSDAIKVFPTPSAIISSSPPALLAQYPWAVSISLNGKNKLGGALISPYHVLTAAHGFLMMTSYTTKCSVLGYRDVWDVRAREVGYGGVCMRGTHPHLPNHPRCPNRDLETNQIRSILVDDEFANGKCVKGHDWAIIELKNRVNFTDKVRPICLPYIGMPIQSLLTVAGWGRAYVFNESSPLLHETRMLHAPNCPRPFTDTMPAHAPDMLCAVSTNTTDFFAPRTCFGDSGSGMQQTDADGRARLVGLTSFGTQGCPANELARFTKVEPYLREICAETGVCYSTGGIFVKKEQRVMSDFRERRKLRN